MAFGAGDVCHHAQFLPSEGDAAISGEPRQAGVRRAVSCAAHHAARRGESPQVHCLRHVHEQLSERYDTGRCSDGDRPRDRQAEAGTRQTPLQSRKLHFLRSVRFGLPDGSHPVHERVRACRLHERAAAAPAQSAGLFTGSETGTRSETGRSGAGRRDGIAGGSNGIKNGISHGRDS